MFGCRLGTLAATAMVVLTACDAEPPARTAPAEATPGPVAQEDGDATAAVCGDVEQTVDQGHHHLVGDAEPPVDYATRPPTSGWHHRERGRVRPGVAPPDGPLSEPEHVTVLAMGGVVISHHGLGDEDLAALTAFVEEHADRVALTPYDALGSGQVALTAWRVRQVCTGYDPAAVAEFVQRHAAEVLDFDMQGQAGDGHEDHS